MDKLENAIIQEVKEHIELKIPKKMIIGAAIQMKAMGVLSEINDKDIDDHYDEILEQIWYECSLFSEKLEKIKKRDKKREIVRWRW